MGRWTTYDVIKLITTEVDYQSSSRGIDVSAFLSIGLSRSVNILSIILSLKSLPSVVKIEKCPFKCP